MEVQQCAPSGIESRKLGRDAQGDMISRCLKFQRLLKHYDEALSDMPRTAKCDIQRVIHNLDMAVQEASEAWDMVEGGWKHHKTKPKSVDEAELIMELVDVAHFLYNAYLFMGGDPSEEMVAASVNRGKQGLSYTKFGIDVAWSIGTRSWTTNGDRMRHVYSHAEGSHGEEWVGEAATRINFLREKIMETAMSCRTAVEHFGAKNLVPPMSGAMFLDTVPWLYAALDVIPSASKEAYYGAFIQKNDINFARQDQGY
jgi:hypothetical protein